MKRRLVARAQANLDIVRQTVYLAERNPKAAERFEPAVLAAFEQIEKHPLSGSVFDCPTTGDVQLRFRRPPGFKNHLIVYQVTDDCIFVIRILHGSQDFGTALRP